MSRQRMVVVAWLLAGLSLVGFQIWSAYIRHICAAKSTIGRLERMYSGDTAVMLEFFYSLCVRPYGLPK